MDKMNGPERVMETIYHLQKGSSTGSYIPGRPCVKV